ncbi:MAG: DUF4253 domain-containing protein [Nostocales cyanobacterium ELA583]
MSIIINLPINNIKQIIKNTIIAETQIIELKIPATEKTALAMEIDIDNKIEAWEIMRNLFSQTQFYPIIVTCWLGKTVINGDLFCRFGYQIELVCHYGTMLQLKTKNKPKTCQEALQLAIEQEIIAPCTTMLPGISLEDHACALLKSDYWFLHERP